MSIPPTRQPYPTNVSDEEWHFIAPYLALVREDAPQRHYPLREVFNGLRWLMRAGAAWRLLQHDVPRRLSTSSTAAGSAPASSRVLVHELRTLLRLDAGRAGQPSAAILDSRTPESGAGRGGVMGGVCGGPGALVGGGHRRGAERTRRRAGGLSERVRQDPSDET